MCILGVLYRLIIYDDIKYLRCTPKVNQQQTEVLCTSESIHTHVGLGQSVIQLRTNTKPCEKHFWPHLLVREILQSDKIWGGGQFALASPLRNSGGRVPPP